MKKAPMPPVENTESAKLNQAQEVIVLRVGCLRRGLFFLTACYLGMLALLWVTLPWIGERNVTVASLLFVPSLVWLLPGAPLGLLLLCFRGLRRWAAVLAAAAIYHGFFHTDYELSTSSPPPSGTAGVLSVLTYNRGEQGKIPLNGFVARTDPDVIVMQDAEGRGAFYRKAEGFLQFPYHREQGEFLLLSRFPIVASAPLVPMTPPPQIGGGRPQPHMAARFEIDREGQHIAIYSYHAMTPRQELKSYRRGAFLYGILGLVPGTRWSERRLAVQSFWDARIADARALLEAVSKEPLPYVVTGDFNAPPQGYISRIVRSKLADAHAEGGSGWGFSFPGVTSNPLALFRPWLRIDYVWAGPQWEVAHCLTEADRPSQHHCVTAWLRLKSAAP